MTTRVSRLIEFQGPLSQWGLIPSMIHPNDGTPLWQQVHQGYARGGGWHDFDGFDVVQDAHGKYELHYPGDPVHTEQGRIALTDPDELLVLFPCSWVMWVKGKEQKIARTD